MSACILVRSTTKWVAEQATYVSIVDDAIASFVENLDKAAIDDIYSLKSFDQDLHFIDTSRPELSVQYLFIVDALNYCFWPDGELEYEHLAGGLKKSVLDNPECISAAHLATIDEDGVQRLLRWPRSLPLAPERARLLREVGAGLIEHFNGQASELVRRANESAAALVSLVSAFFPGFRDHAIYRGRQVFLYKRAQIFVGDVYGAFQGSGMGAFRDIASITCFADYRVPVVLRQSGILKYSADLASKVDSLQQILPGSEEEIEIRACTIEAVERLAVAVAARRGAIMVGQLQCPPPAVHLDWLLWETGEAQSGKKTDHHRTETIYY